MVGQTFKRSKLMLIHRLDCCNFHWPRIHNSSIMIKLCQVYPKISTAERREESVVCFVFLQGTLNN